MFIPICIVHLLERGFDMVLSVRQDSTEREITMTYQVKMYQCQQRQLQLKPFQQRQMKGLL